MSDTRSGPPPIPRHRGLAPRSDEPASNAYGCSSQLNLRAITAEVESSLSSSSTRGGGG
eukprot:CAMPEP_0194342428 /NCGR_PEP_ID=MMETSP0171-20130528/92831_1 /TAXON_ID=218684 /ORGANISM="Corethron pennatum, Strain L29A3" /LENGTH=58 /DNA_ID=CAMNT_0039108159 /DNA_START=74 /DNA_END=246 /DNA_ORIENTATION=+